MCRLLPVFENRNLYQKEQVMKPRDYRGQKGVILLQVLALLTLFGLVGLSFTFYTADVQCERNPTVERSDNGCSKTIGNTTDTRP
jgi:hypothetical protein